MQDTGLPLVPAFNPLAKLKSRLSILRAQSFCKHASIHHDDSGVTLAQRAGAEHQDLQGWIAIQAAGSLSVTGERRRRGGGGGGGCDGGVQHD